MPKRTGKYLLVALLLVVGGFAKAQTPAQAGETVQAPSADAQQKAKTDALRAQQKARAEAWKARMEAYRSGSYLGIATGNVASDRVGPLKLKEQSGVEVYGVDQDSPAGKAGIRAHDVILSVNGEKLQNLEQLRHTISETPPGKTVALGISRDGQLLTLNVQLAKRPEPMARLIPSPKGSGMPFPPVPPVPAIDYDFPQFSVLQFASRHGVLVEDLTPQLGDFFGAKNGDGVLVRSVEKGSAADAAGLKAGDIIIKLNNQRIANASDWRRLMRGYRSGAVSIGIIRDKREQAISMKIPERPSGPPKQSFMPLIPLDMERQLRELENSLPSFQLLPMSYKRVG